MEKIQMATVIAQQAQSVVSQDRDGYSAEERDREWGQTANKQTNKLQTGKLNGRGKHLPECN